MFCQNWRLKIKRPRAWNMSASKTPYLARNERTRMHWRSWYEKWIIKYKTSKNINTFQTVFAYPNTSEVAEDWYWWHAFHFSRVLCTKLLIHLAAGKLASKHWRTKLQNSSPFFLSLDLTPRFSSNTARALPGYLLEKPLKLALHTLQ